jgi:hypothetical protein
MEDNKEEDENVSQRATHNQGDNAKSALTAADEEKQSREYIDQMLALEM